MQANPRNLQAIFATAVHHLIPAFQRQYVWTEKKQWEPLWEDVRSVAERYLQEKETIPVEHMRAHFIGAIVLQQEPNPSGGCDLRLVIDGQQRLTTLQLLIDATQKVFEEFDQQSVLQHLVRNGETWVHDNKAHFYKVWPTSMDQNAFLHVMNNEPLEKEHNPLIVKAHEFFKEQVLQWIKDDPQERSNALVQAIIKLLQIVVIDLEFNDDPNIIFETLNDRGTPLIQADLVKNFILYTARSNESNSHAGKSHADMLHRSYLRKLGGQWWRKNARQGRLNRPRVDIFLNYWITMQERTEVQAGDVFRAVRKYAKKNSVSEIASQIGSMADIYRDIYQRIQIIEKTGRTDTALDRFLYRWNAMDAGVLTPVLLRILSFNLPPDKLERCLHIIESYLVRRMVCRMTAKDYNNLFLSLLQKLEKENADEVIKTFLRDQSADDRIWPNDVHLKNAFLQEPLYRIRSRGRLQFVLVGIENWLREGKTEEQGWKDFNIEHVMPQEWRRNWPLLLDSNAIEDAEAERERLIHTIGNLTLVTGKLNKGLSNAPWAEKRERLSKYSGLLLKDSITSEDVWNEDAIRERSIYLAEVAAKVWPHADRI